MTDIGKLARKLFSVYYKKSQHDNRYKPENFQSFSKRHNWVDVARFVQAKILEGKIEELSSELAYYIQKPWTSPELEYQVSSRIAELQTKLKEMQ